MAKHGKWFQQGDSSLGFPLLISGGGGILMALATAPIGWWLGAWVGMIPLWYYTQQSHRPWQQQVLIAIAWGLGFYGVALWWITGIHPLTWLGVPWGGSIAITTFCWVTITGWAIALPVVWTVLMVWLHQRLPGHSSHASIALTLLTGITLWCSLETLWSQTPLWWPTLAYSQSPSNLWILQWGQLSGPNTINGLLLLVNGLVAIALTRPKVRPQQLILAAIIIFCGAHGIGGLWSGRVLHDNPAQQVNVGLIQGNIPTKIKSSGTGLNLAINRYVSGYKNLASQGADLIVTPETALPYRWSTLQRERDGIYQDLLTTNTPGLLGLFGSHDRGLTNSLFLLNPAEPDNPDPPHYDKVKLVPLGEYIPLTRFLGKFIDRLSPLDLQLIPGEPHQTLITPYGQVSVGICYESAFPKIFRWQTHQGGEFIVTASNNDYYRPAMAAQHHAQDVMRAIENDRWLVEATNTGYSAFVNPRGHTQWQSSLNQYQLKIYPLYRRQTQTIYIRWGDWLLKVLMIITGALWLGKLRSLSPRTMASSDQSNP